MKTRRKSAAAPKKGSTRADPRLAKKYYESVHHWTSKNNEAMLIWAERTIYVFESDNPDLARAFVLLHGLVHDMHEYFRSQVDSFKKGLKVNRSEDIVRCFEKIQDHDIIRYVRLILECSERVSALRDLFSEKQRSAMCYYRHVYSHPVLNGYSVTLQKKADGVLGFDRERQFAEYRETTAEDELETFRKIQNPVLTHVDKFKEMAEALERLFKAGR